MQSKGNLTRLRKQRDLSQREVAEALDVTRQAISQWESGRTFPSMEKQLALCRLYHVSLEELYPDRAAGEEAPAELEPVVEEVQEGPPPEKRRGRWFVLVLVLVYVSIYIWGQLTHSSGSAKVIIIMLTRALIVASILHTFYRVADSLIDYLRRKK